jgi:hypothetical protein
MVTWVILIKLVNDYALVYQQLRQGSENQFVDPDPNGSKFDFLRSLKGRGKRRKSVCIYW